MARIALTEQEVARILAAPKIVREDVRWQPKGFSHWVACELPVENQLKVTLQLHINANLIDRSKYSFALVASRAYRIASFDAGSSHINRHTNEEKWHGQPHKHRWTDVCRDSFAYTPLDIDTSSLRSALNTFCKEVNVEFIGELESVPSVQTSLNF